MYQSNLSWTESSTGYFDVQGLLQLQYATAQTLIGVLKARRPVDVLRALIELYQHGQHDKLREVGADETVRQMWHSAEVEKYSPEHGFKFQLEIIFNEFSPEPFG